MPTIGANVVYHDCHPTMCRQHQHQLQRTVVSLLNVRRARETLCTNSNTAVWLYSKGSLVHKKRRAKNCSRRRGDTACSCVTSPGAIERGVKGGLQEGKVGCLFLAVSARETATVLEDIRFMSDWSIYDTLSEGKLNYYVTFIVVRFGVGVCCPALLLSNRET